ncbi:MAG TPA: hypothetical protein VK700_14865 [Steroidobacteraceae bacterium]|jgi:hypothetical protein|nr:hypothetical protein [Steroidobacteraceae bacterium]
MRILTLVFAIGIATCILAAASAAAEPPTLLPGADPGPLKPLKHERLDSQDQLDSLRSANPRHYAIARKILAAANEICDAQQGAPMRMKLDAQFVGCTSASWLTSNPPKRALSFQIDDTVYSALVEVRNLGAKITPAEPAWGMPLTSPPRK